MVSCDNCYLISCLNISVLGMKKFQNGNRYLRIHFFQIPKNKKEEKEKDRMVCALCVKYFAVVFNFLVQTYIVSLSLLFSLMYSLLIIMFISQCP